MKTKQKASLIMATLQYLFNLLILLALISSSCVANTELHSHTIEISSLLPASVCTPSSTAGTKRY